MPRREICSSIVSRVVPGDDAAVLAQEEIHQGGLAHVRFADDGDGQPFAEHLSLVRVRQQFFDGNFRTPDRGQDLRVGRFFDILVRVVHVDRQQHEQVEQIFAHRPHLFGQFALHLGHGGLQALAGPGADDVDDGFRLRQVDAAVQEGQLRELAPLRRLGAVFQTELQDAAKGHHAAVALDLDQVFAGIGMWRLHEHAQDLVDGLAGFRVGNVAVVHVSILELEGLSRGLFLIMRVFCAAIGYEYPRGDLLRLRAAHADDADAALAVGGGDGGDGAVCVREGHAGAPPFSFCTSEMVRSQFSRMALQAAGLSFARMACRIFSWTRQEFS